MIISQLTLTLNKASLLAQPQAFPYLTFDTLFSLKLVICFLISHSSYSCSIYTVTFHSNVETASCQEETVRDRQGWESWRGWEERRRNSKVGRREERGEGRVKEGKKEEKVK